MEYTVPMMNSGEEPKVWVKPCGGLVQESAGHPQLYDPARNEEFQNLVHDQYAPVRLRSQRETRGFDVAVLLSHLLPPSLMTAFTSWFPVVLGPLGELVVYQAVYV